MAFRRKVRFSRRRSRRRVKRDILTLSVCAGETLIQRAPGAAIIDCFNPAVDAIALCHGGQITEASIASPGSATALQEMGGRGASVRSIQFDLAGWTSCWIFSGTPSFNFEQSAFLVRHYMALCRAEFDVLTFNQTGQVLPVWPRIPNIILSGREVAVGNQQEMLHDPDVEIFWRGYEEAIANYCLHCPPCGCYPGCTGFPAPEACSNCGTVAGPQWFVGTVNMPNSEKGYQSMARMYNTRHVKLRTGRFLKENQAIFLVSNWMTNIPQDSQVLWDMTLYGTAAVRVAK